MALIAYSPAVSPLEENIFNPTQDAMNLHSAMFETSTDWGTMVEILTARSLDQRLRIARRYKSMYHAAFTIQLVTYAVILLDDIRQVILALMQPLPFFYAEELYNALNGLNIDEHALVSILATSTNAEKNEILKTYHKRYGRSLENKIIYKTSQQFRKLLRYMIATNRTESEDVDYYRAEKQAQTLVKLYNSGKDGTKLFFYIMTTESYPHLSAIDASYQKLTGDPLNIYISNLYFGDTMFALWDIMVIANESVAAYFAKCLHDAMSGPGTDEAELTRIIVGRSEIDLDAIDNAFFAKYHQRLADWIADDTSGFYKTALLKLLG